MKKWLHSFLGVDVISLGVTGIQKETLELNETFKKEISELTVQTRDLQQKIENTDSGQLSEVLVTLSNKIDTLIPTKTDFFPSDLAIKDVLGNVVLDFSLRDIEDINLSKAKKIENAALFATSAVNISAFQGISQNLFYATANPSTLMTLNNGVGSAVMGAKGIAGQAPFISAGIGAFAPILLFQATSMLIIQSAINNLSERIELVNKKVELLLKYTEKENEATLITINKKLIALDKQKFYTTEDFVLLENYKDKLTILSNQYRLLALEAHNRLVKNNIDNKNTQENNPVPEVKKKMTEKGLDVLSNLGKKVSKIAEYAPIRDVSKFVNENIFEIFRNSNGDVGKIKQEIVASKLQYFLVLSSIAENLYSQAEFLELKMNYAQINPDSNRIEKAKYLVDKFRKNDLTISSENLILLEDVHSRLSDQILELQKNSDWKKENIEFLKNEISKSFEETSAIITKNQTEIYNLKNSLTQDKPLELAVEYKNGEENIYILNA